MNGASTEKDRGLLVVGDRVTVWNWGYGKPVQEGIAVLVHRLSDNHDPEYWDVRFEGESELYPRFVGIEDKITAEV